MQAANNKGADQTAQADLRLCYSHMAKTGFLTTWLYCIVTTRRRHISNQGKVFNEYSLDDLRKEDDLDILIKFFDIRAV